MSKAPAFAIGLALSAPCFAGPTLIETPPAVEPTGQAVTLSAAAAEGVRDISQDYFNPDALEMGLRTHADEDLEALVQAYHRVEDPEKRAAYGVVLKTYAIGPAKAKDWLEAMGVESRTRDRLIWKATRLHEAAAAYAPLKSKIDSLDQELESGPRANDGARKAVEPQPSPLYESWEKRGMAAVWNLGGSRQFDRILAQSTEQIGGEATARIARRALEATFPDNDGLINKKQALYAAYNISELFSKHGWGTEAHAKDLFKDLIRITGRVEPSELSRSGWTLWGRSDNNPTLAKFMDRQDMRLAGLNVVALILAGRPALAEAVPESGAYLIGGLGRIERMLDAHASLNADEKKQVLESKRVELNIALLSTLRAVEAIHGEFPGALTAELKPALLSHLEWIKDHPSIEGIVFSDLGPKAGALLAKLDPEHHKVEIAVPAPAVESPKAEAQAPVQTAEEPAPKRSTLNKLAYPISLLAGLFAAFGAMIRMIDFRSGYIDAFSAVGAIIIMALAFFAAFYSVAVFTGWIDRLMHRTAKADPMVLQPPQPNRREQELSEAINDLEKELDPDGLKKRIDEAVAASEAQEPPVRARVADPSAEADETEPLGAEEAAPAARSARP